MAERSVRPSPQNSYSSGFAFFYIFNLIVGVGALTLPKAFSNAGYILATILLIVLAVMSYIAATFVIEAMAAANALNIIKQSEKCGEIKVNSSDYEEDSPFLQSAPAREDYEIKTKYEMGTMASMFYPTWGTVLYYICICLYLFGDLSIYAVVCPASLTVVVCTLTQYYGMNHTLPLINITNNTAEMNITNICFADLSHIQVYYIFLSIFIVCVAPFTFFNMTKTKELQVVTTIMRYLAFLLMISLAIRKIIINENNDNITPAAFKIKGLPELFGITIYSFMCQHSLPGMITPMRSKKFIYHLVAFDFALVLVFYLLLAFTGAFSLSDMQDLYSLDFLALGNNIGLLSVGTFVAFYPVFTLSTNFPIISVTLRENLKALAKTSYQHLRGQEHDKFHFLVDRIVFPLAALIPPFSIAFGTQQTGLLVSVTGAFPGVGVQYIIPLTLAFMAQRTVKKKYRAYRNKYKSPLSYYCVFITVLVWSVVSVIVILVETIIQPPTLAPNPV